MIKQKPSVQTELITKCLSKHIEGLEERIVQSNLPGSKVMDVEDVRRQIRYCRFVLDDTIELYKEEREFMLIEYIRLIPKR